MLIEIKTACQFLTNYISSEVSESQSKLFGLILSTLLHAKYASHWDIKNPNKGNAFRAITIFSERVDNTILSAAHAASIPNIGKYLPNELCLWIDPYNVSYKIGDYGNIITLYESPESKTYSPKTSNSTMMTNSVSSSSSKSSKSIHGKHRNSMAEIYVNKGTSQNGRSKKYNGNNNANNFAMKKNLSSNNKETNNNNYPKHNQSNAGNSGKKNESQYHNTNSNNGDLTHKKDHKAKSPKVTYQTKTSPARELSPIAKSLRAQLIAQSRFNIPFLYPKENEVTPANTSSSSFMNDSSYAKPITMAPQILAN